MRLRSGAPATDRLVVAAQSGGLRFRPCQASPQQRSCKCAISLNPPPLRPEPAIYSPLYELFLGNPATWDSPDIALFSAPSFSSGQWQFPGGPGQPQIFLTNPTAALSNLSDVVAVNASVTVSCALPAIGAPAMPVATYIATIPSGTSTASIPIPLTAALQALAQRYPDLPQWTASANIYVDIYHPYDSNPNDNHGINSSNPQILAPGGHFTTLPLSNKIATPTAFNFAIIGPNGIGASLQNARVIVAANTMSEAILNFPAQPSGSNSDITVFAKDDNGNSLGGYTKRLYFN